MLPRLTGGDAQSDVQPHRRVSKQDSSTLLLPALVRAAPLKRPFFGAASPILADASPYWNEINRATNVETLPTPSLIVLMDRVRANVQAMISAAGGDPTRWRPHLKTTKLRPVWRELLVAGVRSFKCATVREATLLLDLVSEEGFEGVDLLVAYPLSRPNVQRLAELAAAHGDVKVAVLCEDEQGVADTPQGLEIWLDVNPLHYNRTGAPAENADQHAAVVAAASGGFAETAYYRTLHRLLAPYRMATRMHTHFAFLLCSLLLFYCNQK